MLEFRAMTLNVVRSFLIEHSFLEVDTPALSTTLIPESSIEVFKTEYIRTYGANKKIKTLFLLPSPELYIKKLIAKHKRSFFQISKCYRNCESTGKSHSPEFSMLEYYHVGKDYMELLDLTYRLLLYIIETLNPHALLAKESVDIIKKGLIIKTIDELFIEYLDFSIAKEHSRASLIYYAKILQKNIDINFENMSDSDIYDMIFVHAIEPNLPKDRLIVVKDYPSFVSCLATKKKVALEEGKSWSIKERWELYGGGQELCNCYNEMREKKDVDEYVRKEEVLKKNSLVSPIIDEDFSDICQKMPVCSGVALGFDRLLMFLTNKKTIDAVLPFPLSL